MKGHRGGEGRKSRLGRGVMCVWGGAKAQCHPWHPSLHPQEPVYKSALSPVAQHVCTYREVRYESLVLPACPPGIDPTFTYPVALSCHCSLCPMDSSDCTVQSIGPDFCSARRGYA